MEQIQGGVTAAKGFEAAGAAANIKYKDRMDMALIYSTVPCRVAGTFTTNVVKAAPVGQGGCGEQPFCAGGCRECRDCECMYGKTGHGVLS